MSDDTSVDLVTGAFSYSGSHIAKQLLEGGRRVRTLTFHPEREHPLQGQIEALAYRFDDPAALVRSLEGVSTLYNTYWVRFDRGQATFANAVEMSRQRPHLPACVQDLSGDVAARVTERSGHDIGLVHVDRLPDGVRTVSTSSAIRAARSSSESARERSCCR